MVQVIKHRIKLENTKHPLTLQEKLSKGIIPGTSISFPYTIKVKFDSIQVLDTHDPGIFTSEGDGEYDLYGLVQGVAISLTDRSFQGICGGSSDPLPCGLGDISHGERAYFSPSAEVTADIPGTMPLSVSSGGMEIDNCGRDTATNYKFLQKRVPEILQQPEETWYISLHDLVNGEFAGSPHILYFQ